MMKDLWPFGAFLRRVVPNRLMLRWLKTVVMNDEEKALFTALGGDRDGDAGRGHKSERLNTDSHR